MMTRVPGASPSSSGGSTRAEATIWPQAVRALMTAALPPTAPTICKNRRRVNGAAIPERDRWKSDMTHPHAMWQKRSATGCARRDYPA
jgi:hypothetical protein